MMTILAALWSYALVAMVAFGVGVWAGVWNGKRAARVDAGFDKLVEITTNALIARSAVGTCSVAADSMDPQLNLGDTRNSTNKD